MLKIALVLALVGLGTDIPNTYGIQRELNRSPVVCENSGNGVLKGIYTEQSYSELETKTTGQDIYVTRFDEGDELPTEFITLCNIKDRLPMLVMRANSCSGEYLSKVVAMLAQYNEPMLFEIDCTSKDFFRQAADIIHSKTPSVAVVWSITAESVNELSTLYPGDFYVDWVAVDIDITGNENGLQYDPYPLYNMLSYFEQSKPLMINLSVAAYGTEGHKYYSYDAAEMLEYIYKLADEGEAIKAVNYVEESTDKWDFSLTLSDRTRTAFSSACKSCKGTRGIRLPIVAYQYGNSLYCEGGEVATTSEVCVIDGVRYYKIADVGKYHFIK